MSRPTDVSIDLETLSSGFDAPILSIGAVAFNRKTGVIGPTYYAEIKLDDALRFGRASASTLTWWMQQDAKAKRVFAESDKKVTVYEALRGLNDFIRSLPAGVFVWGNGSSFDITILERHFDVLRARTPSGEGLVQEWKYWDVRDMRTIVDAANYDTRKHPRVGTYHNALDDARFQAEVIAACLMRITAAITQVKGVPAPAPVAATVEDDEL